MKDEKIKVIYIAGEGRSGSTLLDVALGQHDDVMSTGEMKHIWDRCFIENQLCGCGKPFRECKFWNEVVSSAEMQAGPERILEAYKSIQKRLLRYLILFNKMHFNAESIELIKNNFYALYRSVINVSKCSYIIDSSKDPLFACMISTHPKIDLYVLHTVRDSRAVAYSWSKIKKRPEVIGKDEFMPTYSSFFCARSWVTANLLTGYVGRKMKYYKLVRYEDFIDNPYSIMNDIYRDLGLQTIETADSNSIHLDITHTVAGNPMRFKSGQVDLKLDDEWKIKMKKTEKILVTGLTLPLLKKYGYR